MAAKDASITARDKTIADFQVMSKAQSDEIAAKDAQLNSWYRSPYLYLFLGAAAGLYLGKK